MRPAAVGGAGVERLAVHAGIALPPAQGAEITLVALAGTGQYASVGVGLRWDAAGSGYLVGAASEPPTTWTFLVRLNAGAWTDLDWDAAGPVWQAGDRFRATIDGATLRIFRNGTLVKTLVDATPIGTAGFGAVNATRAHAADAATADDWAAGVTGVVGTGTVTGALTTTGPTAALAGGLAGAGTTAGALTPALGAGLAGGLTGTGGTRRARSRRPSTSPARSRGPARPPAGSRRRVHVAGALTGDGALAGTLTIALVSPLAGGLAGDGTTAGALTTTPTASGIPLAGGLTGAGTLAGGLTTTPGVGLTGALTGTGDTAATLTTLALAGLAGTVTGDGRVTAALTGGTVLPLAPVLAEPDLFPLPRDAWGWERAGVDGDAAIWDLTAEPVGIAAGGRPPETGEHDERRPPMPAPAWDRNA